MVKSNKFFKYNILTLILNCIFLFITFFVFAEEVSFSSGEASELVKVFDLFNILEKIFYIFIPFAVIVLSFIFIFYDKEKIKINISNNFRKKFQNCMTLISIISFVIFIVFVFIRIDNIFEYINNPFGRGTLIQMLVSMGILLSTIFAIVLKGNSLKIVGKVFLLITFIGIIVGAIWFVNFIKYFLDNEVFGAVIMFILNIITSAISLGFGIYTLIFILKERKYEKNKFNLTLLISDIVCLSLSVIFVLFEIIYLSL